MAIERRQGQPHAGRQRPLAAQPRCRSRPVASRCRRRGRKVHPGEDVQAPRPARPARAPSLEPLHGLGLRHRTAVHERVPQVDQAPLRGMLQAGQQVVLDDGTQFGDDQRGARPGGCRPSRGAAPSTDPVSAAQSARGGGWPAVRGRAGRRSAGEARRVRRGWWRSG